MGGGDRSRSPSSICESPKAGVVCCCNLESGSGFPRDRGGGSGNARAGGVCRSLSGKVTQRGESCQLYRRMVPATSFQRSKVQRIVSGVDLRRGLVQSNQISSRSPSMLPKPFRWRRTLARTVIPLAARRSVPSRKRKRRCAHAPYASAVTSRRATGVSTLKHTSGARPDQLMPGGHGPGYPSHLPEFSMPLATRVYEIVKRSHSCPSLDCQCLFGAWRQRAQPRRLQKPQ